jgi:hypothetical protein
MNTGLIVISDSISPAGILYLESDGINAAQSGALEMNDHPQNPLLFRLRTWATPVGERKKRS